MGIGYWKRKESDRDGIVLYWHVCSECGRKPLRAEFNYTRVLSPFCPWCGAAMIEKEYSSEESERRTKK